MVHQWDLSGTHQPRGDDRNCAVPGDTYLGAKCLLIFLPRSWAACGIGIVYANRMHAIDLVDGGRATFPLFPEPPAYSGHMQYAQWQFIPAVARISDL